MEVSRSFLKEHVRQSNKIENIDVRESHHLFMDHLAAAEFVVKSAQELKAIAAAGEIHRILMKRELPEAGRFRKVNVWVGLDSKPRPENVEGLMKRWDEFLQRDIWSRKSKEEGAALAWHYHHWFEAIHPFIDGNGRTGRLILNNIRLLFGLPWWIVLFIDRQKYYDSIRNWEARNKSLFL